MGKGSILIIAPLVVALATGLAHSQPRLVTSTPEKGYRVGDKIDPQTVVLDSKESEVRILDLIPPSSKIAILIIFGGALLEKPAEPFRGKLWCRDSFDDLGLQRALVHHFKNQPVQFIPVAVPPVYDSDRYGYPDNVFLGESDASPLFRQSVADFIEATEALRENSLLPFESTYYDPRFHLAHNEQVQEDGADVEVPVWHGRMKWQFDPRLYGTPVIWVLGQDGTILTKPFFGNDYDSDPPQIEYEFHEVRQSIERLLDEIE